MSLKPDYNNLYKIAESQPGYFTASQAGEAGDIHALEALSETGKAIGLGFAGLINILNPGKILGGPLRIVGYFLLASIEGVATRHSLPEMRPIVKIILSALGPMQA